MKKTVIISVAAALILLLVFVFHGSDKPKTGVYDSEELVVNGLYSVFVDKDPSNKSTGMGYTFEKNKFTIRYVDTDRRSLLPLGVSENVFENISYKLSSIAEYPDNHRKYLERVFGNIESFIVYKLYDQNNNRIGYDILYIDDKTYIYDIYLGGIDKIKLKK